MLFIYRLQQTVNQEYDTYDSCVVISIDAYEARFIQPDGRDIKEREETGFYNWASPDQVKAKYIGVAGPDFKAGDVICASFNAG